MVPQRLEVLSDHKVINADEREEACEHILVIHVNLLSVQQQYKNASDNTGGLDKLMQTLVFVQGRNDRG